MTPRHLLTMLMAVAALGGCATEGGVRPKEEKIPWTESGAPHRLQGLASDLMAFQGASGHMPTTLAQLDRAGLSTAGPYATMRFAYHPAGLGVLAGSWRVMVVDDRVQDTDHAWCVVAAPARRSDAPALRVFLVSLNELRAAAVAADTAP